MNARVFVLAALTACGSTAAPMRDEGPFSVYDEGDGPGVAVMVLHDGEIVEEGGYGVANRATGERISVDTEFNLASDSKQFTAAAALILEANGMLSREDTLARWVPGLPAWSEQIKVKHLIHHTSGLPGYMAICDVGRPRPQTNADVVAELATKPELLFAPGSQFDYSNSGYAMLAVVVEAAAGEPFPAFLEREVFAPLGMDVTYIDSAEHQTRPHRAVGYGEWPHFEIDDVSDCNYIYGDGSIYTSVRDYAKWLKALRGGELVNTSQAFEAGSLDEGESVDYGYGWSVGRYRGHDIVWHNGAWLGFRSGVTHYRELDLWTVVFSNSSATDVDAAGDILADPYLGSGT